MTTPPELTVDELMHLALHATTHNAPDKAITLLKQLLDIEPDNGKAHYLLGALHAEIGMHPLAAEEMARALELEPELHTARFQLGLLKITSGLVDEAESVWAGLDQLGNEDPLYLFKTGMLHLVKDEFEKCVTSLKAGIELNQFNEDLNNDMRKVIADAESAMSQQPAIEAGVDDSNTEASGKHILLSVYENKDSGDQ